MEKSILKVVSVSEAKTASNGRPYKTVQFSTTPTYANIGGRQVEIKSNQKVQTRNIWGTFTDENGNVQKGDSLYDSIAPEDFVFGSICNFQTTPYAIGEREVSSYTCVVFDNEDPIKYANSQLKSNNAEVIVPVSTEIRNNVGQQVLVPQF